MAIEWKTANGLISYPEAVSFMETRVDAIIAKTAPELVWLVEHPPLYTAGTSADAADLKSPDFPLFETGRGGQITYHGPGQRVAYVLLDLKKRNAEDIRAYVKNLEQWLINSLARFDIESFTREGRVGVWVIDPKMGECKIAALGIRVRKWVTYHGISLNISPQLIHYRGIVPCGIEGYGVTSLNTMGKQVSMEEVDAVLQEEFAKIFA